VVGEEGKARGERAFNTPSGEGSHGRSEDIDEVAGLPVGVAPSIPSAVIVARKDPERHCYIPAAFANLDAFSLVVLQKQAKLVSFLPCPS